MAQLNETNQDLKPKNQQEVFAWDPIEELELQVNKTDKDDYEEVVKLLTQILTYPSTQAAELHMMANRLGSKDIRKTKEEIQQMKEKGQSQIQEHSQYCSCCGFVKQEDEIKLCTRLSQINNIGISTFLYFQTIKNIIILLLVMTLVYSIYAFATNLVATGKVDLTSIDTIADTTADVLSISLASKQMYPTDQNQNFYYIQCWLGLAVMIIWVLLFFVIKYFEKEQEVKVQQETISASDFSIVVEGIPKDATKQELQAQLTEYQQTINNIPAKLKRPLTIAKFNMGKPFYLNPQNFKDDELDELKEKIEQYTETFVSWIEQRQDSPSFSTTKQQRQKVYEQYAETLKKVSQKYVELSEKVQEQMKKQSEQTISTAFVTFQTSNAMKIITQLNDPAFSSKLRYYLTCCQGGNRFHFKRNNEDVGVSIQRAPEPEDVKWENLGVQTGQIIKRKVITYVVTLILLGISFAAVYGLSQAQMANQDNWVLSIVISLVISVINVIMGQVIRRLSLFEMDYTETNHQTSLAIKSVLAQLINSILIPMIVNTLIKQKVYERGGLADDVFMLGVTNSFVSPVLKIFDIGFIINRLMKWFKTKPNSKLTSNQLLLNDTCEYIIFQSGYEYIYVVNLFLFTCFFVSLQPIISVFAMGGLGLMYWAQKYSMFNRMQRPVPGTDLINVAMWQIIFLGGIFYSFGGLLWSNILPDGIPERALVPNLIAMGMGIVMFLLPYRAIFALVFEEQHITCHEYNESRLLFPSEYDRLNPLTQKEGFQEYMKFIEKAQEKYDKASEEEKKKIQKKMKQQANRGQHKRPVAQPMFGQKSNPFMPPPQLMVPGMMMPGFGMPPPGYMPPPQQRFTPSPPQNNMMMPPPQQQSNFGPPPPQNQMRQGPPPPPPPQMQGFQPPGMMMRPGFGGPVGMPGFGRPPAGFGGPMMGPPGYGQPPPGFGRPPPGFGQPPPGFGQPPPGFGQPPPGFFGPR